MYCRLETSNEVMELGDVCVICYDGNSAGKLEKVNCPTCHVLVHQACFLPWVREHRSCPICRTVLPTLSYEPRGESRHPEWDPPLARCHLWVPIAFVFTSIFSFAFVMIDMADLADQEQKQVDAGQITEQTSELSRRIVCLIINLMLMTCHCTIASLCPCQRPRILFLATCIVQVLLTIVTRDTDYLIVSSVLATTFGCCFAVVGFQPAPPPDTFIVRLSLVRQEHGDDTLPDQVRAADREGDPLSDGHYAALDTVRVATQVQAVQG